ncbi:hypothetical protein Tco_0365426 [Tanacetum coccineum]
MVTRVNGVLVSGVVVSLAWETIYEIEHAFEDKQYQPEGILELFRKLHDDVQNIHEELVEYINTLSWNRPTIYCDDDDDEDYTIAITPDLPITDSLRMEDEHLDTILATESDELIKSSIENLVPIPSESEDFSDIESEYDVPNCNDSQKTIFSTFSNPLFDYSTSSDDESSHEEVIHEIGFKTYSNPLFDLDEEIISSEFNPIHNEDLDCTPKNDRFDTESYLLESLLNRDTLMASSPKIDSLFDEFAGELITIPPRIVNREHEEYISLLERLLYDNSSPCPPEDFHANPNTIIESLPTFPIPVEDSDSLREEIDIFSDPDDSIPPGIESDDYDSEGDDNSTSLPEFESFHVDYPDLGDSTIDVVEDIPVDVPNIFPPILPFIWISTSFLLIMILDPILMFLLLPEIETRFMIRGYALKSNLQNFLLLFPPYGYIKNHKKIVKNRQARTRESEEYKKKPKNDSLAIL